MLIRMEVEAVIRMCRWAFYAAAWSCRFPPLVPLRQLGRAALFVCFLFDAFVFRFETCRV